MNGRQTTRVWRLRGVSGDDSGSPLLVGPISKCADAIVLGDGKLRIPRKETKLANLSKLNAHPGWCAGSNPLTL